MIYRGQSFLAGERFGSKRWESLVLYNSFNTLWLNVQKCRQPTCRGAGSHWWAGSWPTTPCACRRSSPWRWCASRRRRPHRPPPGTGRRPCARNSLPLPSWGSNQFISILLMRRMNGSKHRLNMKLDLRSLFGLHVHKCTHWLRPRNPPPPAFGLIYEGAIGQLR